MGNFVDRCSLVVLASPVSASAPQLISAAETGLVSSCILYQGNAPEPDFAKFCEASVQPMQAYGVAVLIADNTQLFGRTGADGIYLEKNRNELVDIQQKFSPEFIVGCGGLKNRHAALQVGEAKPDFVMFGKLGGDIRPQAHPKNLALASWWSEIIEVPSLVLAGSSLESVLEAAATGADFVAAEAYVFEHEQGPATALTTAEALLEQHAPRFEEVPA